ncbi:tRNA (guanosine(37)-N1)-methyltransferase TrmD [candidate division KSB1 bacterium]|nr:tRNA (guanosine(37)-N1)-methyltransferase TrmD [candidate division KSB1 bacterium]
MEIHVITAFPAIFESPLNECILKLGQKKKLVDIFIHDLRDHTTDKHRQVDDYPYGGGPGMILKPEPFFASIDFIREKHRIESPKIIFLTPQGKRFTQQKAIELAKEEYLIILCGHYKGIDERIRDVLVDEEISIGDYVLSGGEIPALVIMDSIVRLIPGVMNDLDSAITDSFHMALLDGPYYTRPKIFEGYEVPDILLSGDHAKIAEWRKQKAIERTQQRRSDLLERMDQVSTHSNADKS